MNNSIAIPPATAGDEYDDGEFCCQCGRSVAPGSGRFANRVPDFNDLFGRMEMGRPYPQGEYLCAPCDRGECEE